MAAVLLDWELSVLYCNESAKKMAAIWNLGLRHARSLSNSERFEVPNKVCEECRILKSQWKPLFSSGQSAPSNPEATALCDKSPELRATLRLVDPIPGSLCMPSFLVLFENCGQLLRLDIPGALNAISSFVRLSHCEQEVAHLVCAGHSNKEIAEALGKSVPTVKKQLQSYPFGQVHLPWAQALCDNGRL